MEDKYFFINEEIEFEKVNDTVKRKIVAHGGKVMAVEVYFQKGAVGALHKHFHEQVMYCVKGKVEFELDGEKRIITAGDSVYMIPDSVHGCVALEESILLDVFTPQREDFLKK